MKQLFIIDPALRRAVSRDEIHATVEGLQALNLYHLPYPEITLQYRANDIMSVIDTLTGKKWRISDMVKTHNNTEGLKDADCIFVTLREGSAYSTVWLESLEGRVVWEFNGLKSRRLCFIDGSNIGTEMHSYENSWNAKLTTANKNFIITLLATRNIIKSTRTNKLARLGIGKGHNKPPAERAHYVTTLSIPATLPREDGSATNGHTGPRRAHLRRGHIRHQKYGPKYAFTRAVWIEPMFINADESFVSTRKAYNVTG